MWKPVAQVWRLHDPRFEAEELDPERAAGPWFGHRWFVYDLMRYRAPETVVELGTHYGPSFFAMCQAVKDGGLPTHLHAVDTWEGDPHAGTYGAEVFETFEHVLHAAYAGVGVTLHRTLFSEALLQIVDESVDLLHIDGFHSYEAAQGDFESWLPKLAPNAVVLFHDVAPETGYGSADYWRDLSAQHPGFAFPHSFGLGVLLPKGTEGFEYLLSEEFERWRSYYPDHALRRLGEWQARDHTEMIEERDAALRGQADMIDERDAAMARQADMIDERDAALARQTQMIDDRDAAVRSLRDELGRAEAAVAERQQMVATMEDQLADKRWLYENVTRGLRAGRRVFRWVLRRLHSPAGLGRGLDASLRTVFDAGFYRTRNPDVAATGVNPLSHYLEHGAKEGRDPSPFFSSRWYLERNPDVGVAGVNPLVHYLRNGWSEGRDPGPLFSLSFYRATYPDVAEAGVDPLIHYLRQGATEGRFVSPEHRRRVMTRALATATSLRPEPRRSVESVVYAEPGTTPQLVPLTLLDHVDVDAVTLDLWDTLVSRSRPADSAKLATARRQFLRHRADLPDDVSSPWDLYHLRVRVEAEIAAAHEHEEYLLEDVLAQVYARVLPAQAGFVDADAAAEWSDEIATTYPLREVWSLIDRLTRRADAPRMAVVSDFYVGEERMLELLAAHGWDRPGTRVLVSCEREASKRLDGGLYRAAREVLGADPGRHLHVGDSRHADFDMQLATGGRAALLQLTPSALPAPGALAPDTVKDCYAVLRERLRELAGFQVEFLPKDDAARRTRAAGVASAPLAVGLVARAIEGAQERGLDRVHYLSREGAFLARVHDVVAPALCAGIGPVPRAVTLDVSRRSTFGASLAGLGRDDLMRMWRMYGAQSLRGMLVSLGAEAGDHRAAAKRHGLDLETVVPDIAADPRVAAFLGDPEVVGALRATLAEDRDLLLDYLRQRTDPGAAAMVVADVGWRGSIQDNLAHVLADTHVHGVYLGLFPFLNPQPANTSKEAVGFDGNAGDEFAFAEPPAAVERPWTPHVPSTVGYARHADGRVVPVHAQETYASPLIDDFQEGVLAAAPLVADFLVRFGFTVPLVRDELKADLRAYYERPAGGTADIWFGSDHDDTFGALNVTPFGKDAPDGTWLTDEGGRRLLTAATASRWEPGFVEWLPVAALRELRHMVEEQR